MSRLSSLAPRFSSLIIDHWTSIIANGSLIFIGLVLAAPLLQNTALCTDDGALHLYRTVALDRALHDGLLYPRWLPDLAYGYGFPFFNYREPLGYYLLEFIHLLGVSVPLALNQVLAGSLIASGLTMSLWVSDVFDRPSGFVAGVVYMAAPYTAIDALARANLPEAIALALLPLILWAFRRLMIHGKRKYFAVAVLSLAALLLTHNISSLIFVPFLIAYCVMRPTPQGRYAAGRLRTGAYRSLPMTNYKSPQEPSARSMYSALRPALFALLLALALTAFFWLPALMEGQAAQLYLTHSARGNDYHFNFATVGEAFGPPGSSDPLLLNPPLRIVLGWVQIVLAVLGVVLIRRLTSREQRAHVIFMALAALFFIILALPISLPLWDTLPLIRFVQFPWRFVGRAILPVAVLAGAGAYAVFHAPRTSAKPPCCVAPLWGGTQHASRFARYSLLMTLFLLFTLPALLSAAPLLYPRVCPGKSALDIGDVFAYEHATGHVGVDPLGAYLPVTVIERPSGSPLEAQYAAHEPIKRFDRSALPEGAQIVSERYRPNDGEIVLDTPFGFQATYLTFAFPGWQVSIDDRPTPLVPSEPYGLITFEVPAGRHRIEVSFGDTPPRTLANAISLAGLVVFSVVLVRPRHRVNTSAGTESRLQADIGFAWWMYLVVPLAFLSIKGVFVDAQLTPLRQTHLQNGALTGVEHPLHIDFGDRLRLLGYTLSPGSTPAGETTRLDLYWQALRPLEENYQTTAGLVDANGEVWSPKTLDRPRDYQDYPATSTWSPDAYVVDSFEIPILPGAPPGEYAVFVEAFERDSLWPLPAQASASHPDSRPAAAIIGPLDVTRATQTFTADELGIYNLRADQTLTPAVKLIGANRDRSEVLSGETVLLTLFWQALQQPTPDYTATIELIDEQNKAVLKQDFPLGDGRYPTSQWTMDEQIVDLDRVRVPVDLASGQYRWRISIGGGEPIELGDLRVTAPERSFEAPPITNRIDQTLGNQATLLGFENADCGAPLWGCGLRDAPVGMRDPECKVKLYWRAEQDMPKSYKVFVQLLDANGTPRAQADVIPGNGTRPTWSWLPGEVISHEVVLQIPADLPVGTYRLTAGLYGEMEGQRLTLPDGKDFIELTTIELKP